MRNEILKLLETDSRLTVKDIAAMLGDRHYDHHAE